MGSFPSEKIKINDFENALKCEKKNIPTRCWNIFGLKMKKLVAFVSSDISSYSQAV